MLLPQESQESLTDFLVDNSIVAILQIHSLMFNIRGIKKKTRQNIPFFFF